MRCMRQQQVLLIKKKKKKKKKYFTNSCILKTEPARASFRTANRHIVISHVLSSTCQTLT